MTVVGTRPEVIKLSRVIAALERHTEHVLVHSGQNYDHALNGIFFDQLEIPRPRHVLGVGGGTVAETIAAVIVKSDRIMEEERPDALLLYGDTNTCLCVIPAKRRKIPVFHMEAGNRCFDQRVPEELNRKVVDHLSDINLPLTEHARRYLLAEGLRPETVIRTGSPMAEVLAHYRPRIEASTVLAEVGLSHGQYFLVSAHREENVDSADRLSMLLDSLRALVEVHGLPVLVSTHPRTQARLRALGADLAALEQQGIRFTRPFGFLDYIQLQLHARCVISDSGTITEESAILGFPAVTIRDAHERPEGMDKGVLVMTGLSADRILDGIDLVVAGHAEAAGHIEVPPDYGDLHVSQQVVQVIHSYVDYVNRTVWGKA
jgi:UDP-N-acetylglucosamine 2-epimerase (non-hydrolysing)